MRVLTLDIGGTKMAAAVWDGALGPVSRVPTGTDPWASVTSVLDPLKDDVDAIGVACGGPMEWPAGVVAPLNIPAWVDGFPLRDELAARYGVPVRLHNDAICVAIAEHSAGGWGTNDLLMGDVLRRHELQVWFLSEHVVDMPLVDAASSVTKRS